MLADIERCQDVFNISHPNITPSSCSKLNTMLMIDCTILKCMHAENSIFKTHLSSNWDKMLKRPMTSEI